MARVIDPELTKARLHLVVEEMYDRIVKGDPPTMTLPVRTKNNIGFDRKLGTPIIGLNRGTLDKILKELNARHLVLELANNIFNDFCF